MSSPLSERIDALPSSDRFVVHFGLADETARIGGGITLVIDRHGRIGWSLCTPDDTFSKRIGLHGAPAQIIRCRTDGTLKGPSSRVRRPAIPGALARLTADPVVVPDWVPSWTLAEKFDYLGEIASEILYRHSRFASAWPSEITVVALDDPGPVPPESFLDDAAYRRLTAAGSSPLLIRIAIVILFLAAVLTVFSRYSVHF